MVASHHVFLALANPMVKSSLELRMRGFLDLVVVGEAGNGQTALVEILASRPRVAVIEDNLPIVDGLSLAQALAAQAAQVRTVLLLSPGRRDRLSARLLEVVDAVLFSDDNPGHIVQAIRSAAVGKAFICPLLGVCNACEGFGEIQEGTWSGLTETQRDILGLMAEERDAHTIGRMLGISYRAVQRERELICQQLQVSPQPGILEVVAVRHAGGNPARGAHPDAGNASTNERTKGTSQPEV